MRTRILVGLVALPFVLLPLWFGGVWTTLLIALVALAAGNEYFALMRAGGYRPASALGMAWLVLLAVSSAFPNILPQGGLVVGGMIVTLTYCLFQVEQPLHTWLSTSAGAIFLGLALSQGLALRLLPNGLSWLLFGVLLTWANDTIAYFTGVSLGKNKLWPRLSPKKTWEGTVGGWIGAAVVGGALTVLTPLGMNVAVGAAVGFVVGVLSLFGDLAESMIKRQVGVKDSGKLFPGHGGMLDRLDSISFVLPFVYQVALWLGN